MTPRIVHIGGEPSPAVRAAWRRTNPGLVLSVCKAGRGRGFDAAVAAAARKGGWAADQGFTPSGKLPDLGPGATVFNGCPGIVGFGGKGIPAARLSGLAAAGLGCNAAAILAAVPGTAAPMAAVPGSLQAQRRPASVMLPSPVSISLEIDSLEFRLDGVTLLPDGSAVPDGLRVILLDREGRAIGWPAFQAACRGMRIPAAEVAAIGGEHLQRDGRSAIIAAVAGLLPCQPAWRHRLQEDMEDRYGY